MKKRIIIGVICLVMLISVVIVDINADPDPQKEEMVGQYIPPIKLYGEYKRNHGQYACAGPSSKINCSITVYF